MFPGRVDDSFRSLCGIGADADDPKGLCCHMKPAIDDYCDTGGPVQFPLVSLLVSLSEAEACPAAMQHSRDISDDLADLVDSGAGTFGF